ncbi:MAG: adenylate kinase [Bacteroidales bacterium]|nr:adenylate kinase [Bacteroidales bacterium]
MLNIALFGPPGAGKGTQSERLIAKYGLLYISTGDILRKEIASGSHLGQEINRITSQGHFVSDELIMRIIRKTIDENPHVNGILFDGFPRTISQAILLEELIGDLHTRFFGVLSLEVPREELIKRLINRGKVSGRSDDREDVILERLREYESKTLPVAGYFQEKGFYYPVDGTGSLEEIFNRLVEQIDKHSNLQ